MVLTSWDDRNIIRDSPEESLRHVRQVFPDTVDKLLKQVAEPLIGNRLATSDKLLPVS